MRRRTRRRSVDLPEPDSPTIPSVSPGSTDRLTSLTAGAGLARDRLKPLSKVLVRLSILRSVMPDRPQTSTSPAAPLQYPQTVGLRRSARWREGSAARRSILPAIRRAAGSAPGSHSALPCAPSPKGSPPEEPLYRGAADHRRSAVPALLRRRGRHT